MGLDYYYEKLILLHSLFRIENDDGPSDQYGKPKQFPGLIHQPSYNFELYTYIIS
jgi:hypothetical protein